MILRNSECDVPHHHLRLSILQLVDLQTLNEFTNYRSCFIPCVENDNIIQAQKYKKEVCFTILPEAESVPSMA